MNQALWIAKTGLDAQQMRMSVVSNNLANTNTTGFKRDRANFEDLLYQQLRQPGGSTSAQTQLPSGLQLGTGVRVVSTSKDFSQGNPQQTGRALDVMVNGRGFFEVQMPDGTSAYTRDGTFHKMTAQQWNDVINTNLNSVFNVTRPVIEGMRERKWGRIIQISSINGLKGQYGQANYAAAKAGMHGFTISLARENARNGITVNTISPGYIATDINESGIATLSKDGIAETARLDVRSTADVNSFAKRVGKIDILLNAAGFVHHGTILECSDEDFDFSFDLNVKSMHRTIKAFLPAMLAGGGGNIVNISSCAALRPPANRYVYSASKAAVSLLTRAVALDFITKGIRCNSICPGTVETPSMLERAAAAGPDGREKFVARQKMGRLGTAEEIAAMAVYLASDEAAFTTGVDMVVDGGFML